MTKTESRSPVELDELPPWDDEETLQRLESQSSGADSKPLAVYTIDSEQRTLVGLGPLERARRLREAASSPQSQRMPPSEPPGPFIADDELPPSFRSRKLNPRALAVPAALLIGLAIVGVVRGLSPREPVPGRLASVAGARFLPTVKAESSHAAERAASAAHETHDSGAQHEQAANESVKPERSAEHAITEKAASAPAPAPTPVRLPDVPPAAAIVDRTNGDATAGSINVTSTPPANVVLDGRPLGKSPRVVRVPPGSHTLVFIHPLYGRRTVSVKVHAGTTASAAAEF